MVRGMVRASALNEFRLVWRSSDEPLFIFLMALISLSSFVHSNALLPYISIRLSVGGWRVLLVGCSSRRCRCAGCLSEECARGVAVCDNGPILRTVVRPALGRNVFQRGPLSRPTRKVKLVKGAPFSGLLVRGKYGIVHRLACGIGCYVRTRSFVSFFRF